MFQLWGTVMYCATDAELPLIICMQPCGGFDRCHMHAGEVTSHKGVMQIQIGSSWGKVEKVNGLEV